MRKWIVVGALDMAIGVALGAFGAHALREVFDARQLALWHTAQEYQVWHALALVLLGLVGDGSLKAVRFAAWSFSVGTAVFSGSLYLLALTEGTWLGAVTPIGGAMFIAGWVALALSARFKPQTDQ